MDETLDRNPGEPDVGAGPPIPPLPELIKVVDHSPVLERAARKTGWALGRLVAAARERLRENGLENASEKVRVISEQGKARSQETGEFVAARVENWGELARERGREFVLQSREWWSRSKARIQTAAMESPVEVALAAGAAGFVLGVVLRIRRARHV